MITARVEGNSWEDEGSSEDLDLSPRLIIDARLEQ